MRNRTKRTGAALALTAGFVVGCESSRNRTPYADNPLIQARQPLLQPQPTLTSDQMAQVAQSGPRMVVVPPPALYQGPATAVATRTGSDAPPPMMPATPTYTPPAPTVSVPAPPAPPAPMPPSETATAPAPAAPTPTPLAPAIEPVAAAAEPNPVAVTQAVVRQVEGKYGHAVDHSWLQGELDRHYRGHLELRFRPASEEDRLGGKVRLEDDPRLAEFRPGDVIAIEGELLTDPSGATPSWSQYRRYHIRNVRLVERK